MQGYGLTTTTDPGFAYGGVYPGRLHAKGRIVERHEVRFSVGGAGTYLLHIRLRKAADDDRSRAADTSVPGSPFTLTVVPGRAYPMATQIDPSVIPLRGRLAALPAHLVTAAAASSHMPLLCGVCEMVLEARDKFGNRCESGGADVSAGFLDEGLLSTSKQRTSDNKGESDGQTTSTDFDQSRGGACVDLGDGSYRVVWHSVVSGSFHAFVKIDGLHVLGSPVHVHFGAGEVCGEAPSPSIAPTPSGGGVAGGVGDLGGAPPSPASPDGAERGGGGGGGGRAASTHSAGMQISQ
jgi:hypothetical protein